LQTLARERPTSITGIRQLHTPLHGVPPESVLGEGITVLVYHAVEGAAPDEERFKKEDFESQAWLFKKIVDGLPIWCNLKRWDQVRENIFLKANVQGTLHFPFLSITFVLCLCFICGCVSFV